MVHYLLCNLKINRVDIVEEGANSAAFIELYKRREHSAMNVTEILEKMKPEHAQVIKDAIAAAESKASSAEADLAKYKADAEKLPNVQKELDTVKADLAKACSERDAANTRVKELEEKEKKDKAKEDGLPFDETETLKSLPPEAKAYIEKLRAQKEAAEAEVLKQKEAAEEAEALKKASVFKSIPVDTNVLASLIKKGPQELIDVLTTINAAFDGVVLTEKGRSGGTSETDAWAEIEAKADALVKEKKGLTKQAAISEVIKSNPDLYRKYLQGGAE
jgi:hypothetical protein